MRRSLQVSVRADCSRAALKPPRRLAALHTKPYARGGAKTSGGLPCGRMAGATPACRGQAGCESVEAATETVRELQVPLPTVAAHAYGRKGKASGCACRSA